MKSRVLWYVVTGAVAGLAAGFLGIGGGIILVPMMVAFLGLSEYKAHGTSLAIIVPISIVGAAVYAIREDINWTFVAAISAGSVFGVIAGAKLMMRMTGFRLRQLFGLYTVAIATLLLLR